MPAFPLQTVFVALAHLVFLVESRRVELASRNCCKSALGMRIHATWPGVGRCNVCCSSASLGFTFLSVLAFVSCCSSHLSWALLLGPRVFLVALSAVVLLSFQSKRKGLVAKCWGWMRTLVRSGGSRGRLLTPSLQHVVKIACKCSSRFTAPAASAPGKCVSPWPDRVPRLTGLGPVTSVTSVF